jgi:hypothetical protein
MHFAFRRGAFALPTLAPMSLSNLPQASAAFAAPDAIHKNYTCVVWGQASVRERLEFRGPAVGLSDLAQSLKLSKHFRV